MKIAPSLLAVALMAFAPVMTAGAAFSESKACPPGLAKKNPPFVPPGQAKKGVTTDPGLYRIGQLSGSGFQSPAAARDRSA